ncbi:hypothetical protein Tco_1435431, partial [Tanacetum coccineum]
MTTTTTVVDALSRKERVKPRRVRAMAMSIQYGVRGMILTAQIEAFKQENVLLVGSKIDEAHASRSHVLWAEIGESSLTGFELVLDTTDKVVLTKEKLKAASDRQNSYADERRKPLEFEVGDRVLLKVSPWKGVLRLPEELSSVHDTFHVSNLKKCLADAKLQVSLNEIKVDKTLCFVEEPVEYSDREVMRFLTSFLEDDEVYVVGWFFSLGVVMLLFVPLSGQATLLAVVYLVKVCWNSKCGPA